MSEQISADFVRQVRLALEVLGGLTSMSPTNELTALVGGGKAYLETGMNDQNSNISFNDHIEFSQQRAVDASGRIAMATGAGQANGLFTLAAGGVYLCVAFVSTSFSAAGFAGFHWRDNTAAAFIGGQGSTFSVAAGDGPRGFCAAIIAPAVETEVELRFNSAPTNLTEIDGSGPEQETQAHIIEIG